MGEPREVTARAATDETLEGLGSAFESAAIGMALVSFEGAFLRVNRALCKLLRRSSEELLGTTWSAVTHPDDVPAGIEHSRRMQSGEVEAFRLEKRYILPDGELLWAMLNVSLIRDASNEPFCMFTQVVDLTQHREGEDARDRLAAIAEASDDAVIGCTTEGAIIAWNRGAQSIFGYSGQEVMWRHISLIVPPDRREELELYLENVRVTDRASRVETVCLSKHGRPIDVSATLSPIPSGDGSVAGVSLIARDITEQRWLATTLDTTLVALEDALARAQESEARSRRFLADAAHQLRTPIAGIQACTETLLRGVPATEIDHLLMSLVRETTRASQLIRSLLRMARLDQGVSLAPRPCNLAALCADEIQRARPMAPHLEISCRFVGIADEPLSVDSHAVREILANLLDNARRFAHHRIEVVVRASEDQVELRVVDDGPGLADDMVDRAFERFVSLDNGAGSGLGLPIARELARVHGGDLVYEGGAFVTTLKAVPSESG